MLPAFPELGPQGLDVTSADAFPTYVDCGTCNGERGEPYYQDGEWWWANCPACGGTGRIEVED